MSEITNDTNDTNVFTAMNDKQFDTKLKSVKTRMANVAGDIQLLSVDAIRCNCDESHDDHNTAGRLQRVLNVVAGDKGNSMGDLAKWGAWLASQTNYEIAVDKSDQSVSGWKVRKTKAAKDAGEEATCNEYLSVWYEHQRPSPVAKIPNLKTLFAMIKRHADSEESNAPDYLQEAARTVTQSAAFKQAIEIATPLEVTYLEEVKARNEAIAIAA